MVIAPRRRSGRLGVVRMHVSGQVPQRETNLNDTHDWACKVASGSELQSRQMAVAGVNHSELPLQ
jgi:hypothetical protein